MLCAHRGENAQQSQEHKTRPHCSFASTIARVGVQDRILTAAELSAATLQAKLEPGRCYARLFFFKMVSNVRAVRELGLVPFLPRCSMRQSGL